MSASGVPTGGVPTGDSAAGDGTDYLATGDSAGLSVPGPVAADVAPTGGAAAGDGAADAPGLRVRGWRCAVCGGERSIAEAMPWRCPNAIGADRHHHVLQLVNDQSTAFTGPPLLTHSTASAGAPAADQAISSPTSLGENRPFERYDHLLAWAAHAEAHGIGTADRLAIVRELDRAIEQVAGIGFRVTPFARSDSLSDALGFAPDGGIYVKDETHGVAGSQKARHLFTILLHLRALEELGQLPHRVPLAIASCGNAALAAATLARAADWPIDVYVPTWMDDAFGVELDRLGATTHRCERRPDDPPGDPAMHRFRAAVADGAIPFTGQGPENALALDGGRTIGWEIGEQAGALGGLDQMYVQVGGGAFATCLGAGLADLSPATCLHAVQVEGCAPLERAWRRAVDRGLGPREVAAGWADLMTAWDDPHSAADGILDDETYDWLGVFDAMHRSEGDPVVAAEADVLRANGLAVAAGYEVSVTGSAGLAGVIASLSDTGVTASLSAAGGHPDPAAGRRIDPHERVGVVMSGVAR